MYFEDIATDASTLQSDHKFHWLEKALKTETPLKKKDFHDKEHEEQLIHWGCDPTHTSKLSIRKDENGQAFSDRMYHIALHLKYWKELQIQDRMKYVERFEEESGYNLDNLTLPKPSDKGESVY